MLKRTPDTPNKPVRSGVSGSSIPRLNTIKPSVPERINAKNAEDFFFSVVITLKQIKIKTKGIIFWPNPEA